LVSVYGSKAFALMRLDRLETNQKNLTVEEIPVALTRPGWLD